MSILFGISVWGAIASAFGIPMASPVPPPVEQLTADCASPVYASDHFVCADAELRSLDRQVAAMLVEKPDLAQRNSSDYFEAQPLWFKRRSLCAMQSEQRACLAAAYAERLRVIELVGSLVPSQPRSKRCQFGKTLRAGIGAPARVGELLLLSTRNEVLGVALLENKPMFWKPFLRYSSRQANVQIAGLSTRLGKCRIGA